MPFIAVLWGIILRAVLLCHISCHISSLVIGCPRDALTQMTRYA